MDISTRYSKLTPLCKLAYKYGTDKYRAINHSYTPFYYEFLKDKRHSIKKVLEMGIGNARLVKLYRPNYVTGASLFMWRDFFPNAIILGVDNDPETQFADERIKTFLCDETKKEDLEKLIIQTGSNIDLFIDDGSHSSSDQYFLCHTIMPLLRKRVIYIIEDVRLPKTLHMRLLRSGYDCYIPKLPPGNPERRPADNVIFVVKPKQ